jgi:hypothetical protein
VPGLSGLPDDEKLSAKPRLLACGLKLFSPIWTLRQVRQACLKEHLLRPDKSLSFVMSTMVRFWILLSAFAVGGGWLLSAVHELNCSGYAVTFLLAAAGFAVFFTNAKHRAQIDWFRRLAISRRRFKRPAPCFFLVMTCFSLAAGLLYAPADGDSNAYRIPRVLHWLGAGQWHWISTLDVRMNISGCGFEWLSAPIILFTDSFRFVFLINWISFLLLPGLIFSVFIRLQVPCRVAWWWMWLLAAGWCYAMQASSIINDSFAAVYALASVDFALRARERGNVTDAWLSLIAAALVTGTKQTIVPLVLVCVVAILPCLKLLRLRPLGTIFVLFGSLLVSAVPLFFFNKVHTGLWLGIPPNTGSQAMFWARCEPDSPIVGIVGNVFCIPAQNLAPPIFPWAGRWNEMMKHFLQTPFGSHFVSFEDFGLLGRAVTAGNAGLGLGICALALISMVAARRSGSLSVSVKQDSFLHLLRWAPFVALLIFMAKVGSHSNARQLAPYYVFFFPALLAGVGQSRLTRRRWWRVLGVAAMLSTAVLLVISREHPLFPAESIVAVLKKESVGHAFVAKIDKSLYYWDSTRMVIANPLKDKIPQAEHVVGYATVFGYCEPGLWLPLGSRTVDRMLPDMTAGEIFRKNIHYVLIGDEYFSVTKEKDIGKWLNDYHGQLIDQTTYYFGPTGPIRTLYLVRLP